MVREEFIAEIMNFDNQASKKWNNEKESEPLDVEKTVTEHGSKYT